MRPRRRRRLRRGGGGSHQLLIHSRTTHRYGQENKEIAVDRGSGSGGLRSVLLVYELWARGAGCGSGSVGRFDDADQPATIVAATRAVGAIGDGLGESTQLHVAKRHAVVYLVLVERGAEAVGYRCGQPGSDHCLF